MLLEEFDSVKSAIINPSHFQKKLPNMPKTCVGFFSDAIVHVLLKTYKAELVTESINNGTKVFPVYKINVDGRDIAVMNLPLGAPASVGNCEELFETGVENLLAVGSCGCLQREIDEYAIIIPTSALRDEGTSYHYAPAEDETIINPEMIDVLEKAMIEKKLHYKKGKTWTTDAIFRETKKKVDDRVKQGAIVVDMECSALNVLAEFRGVNFGQFFYAADNLGGEEYDVRTLVTNNKDEIAQKKIIALALDCGVAIDKKFND